MKTRLGQSLRSSLVLAGSICFAFAGAEVKAAEAPSLDACLAELDLELAQDVRIRDEMYQVLDGRTAHTGAPGIRPGDEPRLLHGDRTDQAVVLIHGFLASPFEVQELGEALNRQGYTVFMPLIMGFGSTERVANKPSLINWRRSVTNAVGFVGRCYRGVALMGFSLGGGLSLDYVLRKKIPGEPEVRSLTLLSPYVRAKLARAKSLVVGASKIFSTFPLDRDLLRGNPDLVAIFDHPEHYNRAIPLHATSELLELGEALENKVLRGDRSKVPVFLGVSLADQTIDIAAARTFVAKHFEQAAEEISFPESLRVPHQIALSQYNSRFEDMVSRLLSFIQI